MAATLPRWPDSYSRQPCGEDRARTKLCTVPQENFRADRALLTRAEADTAHDYGVREPANDRQFAEILVAADENPLLPVGTHEDFLMPGITVPFGGPDDVVAGLLKDIQGHARNAGVEKELHAPTSMENGSIRSCPTRR